MSDSIETLRHKINSASELESVVRTMKALAASSILQYERAVRSLDVYYHTVELGLAAWLRQTDTVIPSHDDSRTRSEKKKSGPAGVVVFGSDQGLIGRFNEVLAEFSNIELNGIPGKKIVWAVGERTQGYLNDAEILVSGNLQVPNSIAAITPLVGHILLEIEKKREQDNMDEVYIFHNRPITGAIYEPVIQRLLPLDERWWQDLSDIPWPTNNYPEVMDGGENTLDALIREYLFISLFRACTESLASENASRLAAMQRAEKNIGELQEDFKLAFHQLRQSSIDEELFDVISGFEALSSSRKSKTGVLQRK